MKQDWMLSLKVGSRGELEVKRNILPLELTMSTRTATLLGWFIHRSCPLGGTLGTWCNECTLSLFLEHIQNLSWKHIFSMVQNATWRLHVCVCVLSRFSCLQLFATHWLQLARFLGVPDSPGKNSEWIAASPPEDLPNLGIEPSLLCLPLGDRFLPLAPHRKP